MTYDELNEDQRLELKQWIVMDRNEHIGEGTSYGELADADELVSDEDLRDRYEGTEFSEDDFACSCSGRTAMVEKIPKWAVCYLVYGEDGGLETWDKARADAYVEMLKTTRGLRLAHPVRGTESEFELHPAFGLPCGTVDFVAEEVRSERGQEGEHGKGKGAIR